MALQKASKARIAIIGAGMTGLSCADQLKKHGLQPKIFEKSRGIGGRLATRRINDDISFDHGVQFVTARSAEFKNLVQIGITSAWAQRWHPNIFGGPSKNPDEWIVGAPSMNALVRPLAEGADIRFSTEVMAVGREESAWRVRTHLDEIGEKFDIVISTVPAPQVSALLNSEFEIANLLDKVSVEPCWALMLIFQTPFDPGFDVWRSDVEDLVWICRNSSKPNRGRVRDCWVVHTSPSWSQRYLELDRGEIAKMITEMLQRFAGGQLPQIKFAVAHRWRYARTIAAFGNPYLCLKDRTLFIGGDWCLGARVECAFESGRAIADALIDAPE